MNINERIKELAKTRGWTEYRVAKESGLSHSTVANIYHRDTLPSIPTLEAICRGFEITLAQFFAENALIELDEEEREAFYKWRFLTSKQRTLVSDLINSYDYSNEDPSQ